jgi:uncharacterized protein (TIGR00299 family) protein
MTLHFDCFAGISGDMALGALVDLGVEPQKLRAELQKLNIAPWTLDFTRDERCGISGTYAVVREAGGGKNSGHSHTHWSEIRAIIERAPLSAGAKARALEIFGCVAKAEAKVHGVSVDDVAFHEVGAIDSIIDIVGTAVCLDMLAPARITASAVELGGGTVNCAHGVLPVPAPATLEICAGLPVKSGGFEYEMTTPTGAAILAASVDEFIDAASWVEVKTAYGLGTRQLEKPNVLRASLRKETSKSQAGACREEERYMLETNIDDMTGEGFGFLMESLFEAGALDVSFIPCVMKKSRPATVVSVLCAPETRAALRSVLFRRSTTIGLREYPVRRYALRREERTVSGMRTKSVEFEGQRRTKIEYDDRAAYARKQDIPLDEAAKHFSV